MLVGSNTKTFEKPKATLYQAVLADIVDLGIVKRTFRNKTKEDPMVRFVWILNGKDSEGRYFRVQKQYAASMFKKANLYAAVKDILGKEPADPFELETLIGINARLVIGLDTDKDNKVWANIKAILPLEDGVPRFEIPKDFVRAKDKEQAYSRANSAASTTQAAPASTQEPVQETEDEEIPF